MTEHTDYTDTVTALSAIVAELKRINDRAERQKEEQNDDPYMKAISEYLEYVKTIHKQMTGLDMQIKELQRDWFLRKEREEATTQ